MKEFTLPTYAEATLDGFPLVTYMEIVCCIPKGYLVTKDAILTLVSEQLGHEYTRVASNGWFVPNMRADLYENSGYAFREYQTEHKSSDIPSELMIPFWRVVSSEGEISHNRYEDYVKRLKEEGFVIGDDDRIEDFEKYLYDLGNIRVTAPKLGKSVKSEKYNIPGRIGDPFYRVEYPDYCMRFEKIMKFKVTHDPKHDYIDAIRITSEGISYYYDADDNENVISPDELVFLSKSEANAFVKKYCSAFNNTRYKFHTKIYTQNGEEVIESANIDRNHDIYFVTKDDNEYYLKDENKIFSYDPEFIRIYMVAKTTVADGEIIGSEYLGEYIGIEKAKKL